jgi:O-antigen/teichoic acid export membrane protein|tara:strand:+ start:2135 stop:3583 length:1449 start_codon:yes stop_codon:yes gene_type:complete
MIRQALFFSSLSQYIVKLIAFISVIVFARLLTPEELGVFAIASSLSMLVTEIRLLGTSNYLVREKELTAETVQQGLGLTLLISWSLGLFIIITANFVSEFYGINDLATIFSILGLGFFLAPFISVISSLLSREFKYQTLMVSRLITQVVTFVVSLTLVLLGYSYYGLAWGVLVGSIAQFFILVKAKPAMFTWIPKFNGLRKIVKFGLLSSGTNLLQRFDATLPDLVIGKLGTPVNVAIFSRAGGLLSFVTQLLVLGVRPVSLPYLSQVKRDGGDLKEAYIKATLLLGSITWPILLVVGFASFPAIVFMFGEQWIDSTPLVSILVYWAVLRVIHTLSPSLLMASENDTIMFIKQLIVFITMLLGMILAFPYGLKAVAWAMVLAGLVDFILASWTIKKAIGLSIFTFISSMSKNIVLCIVCSLFTIYLDHLIDFETTEPGISMLVIAATLPFVWLGTVFATQHPIKSEILYIYKKLKNLGPISK